MLRARGLLRAPGRRSLHPDAERLLFSAGGALHSATAGRRCCFLSLPVVLLWYALGIMLIGSFGKHASGIVSAAVDAFGGGGVAGGIIAGVAAAC